MADDKDKDLEQRFRRRQETLREFYDTEGAGLTDEELASLTPILNSLRDAGGRYEEVGPLAEGGEKRIALVHDRRLDRRVAMARAVRADQPQELEQFLREARLTANLAHPHIMPVYNMGLDGNGMPFFSMELVEGDSLKTIVERLRESDADYRQRHPLETLLGIYAKVCDAIAYAHSRNVIHLDIKPGNIRVGAFGEVRVCDWGLARVLHAPDEAVQDRGDALDADVLNDMTLSGTMKGTPGFMAPEQTVAYGEKTPRTDIYALGALLYMLLTYELPVEGASANEVVQNTREGKIVPPRRRKAGRTIPRSLAAVALKALSLEPDSRYASVLELREEIDRYLTGYPTLAERAGWMTRTSLLLQRHDRIAFLIIVFLLVLAFVVSGTLVVINREKERAVAARQAAEANFRLYLKEQQLTQSLGEDLGEAVLYTVRSRDFVNAPSMIHVLETGLEENVDTVKRQHLLEQKGTLHFVLEEFAAALECFEAAGEDAQAVGPLVEASRKYAAIKPQDKRRLGDQQLADLINEQRDLPAMTVYYLYYHHMRRRPASAAPEEYLPLAEAMLDRLNAVSRRSNRRRMLLVRTDEGYHLDLSRTGYVNFSFDILGVYRRNVLGPFKLHSLDISYGKGINLNRLAGLGIKELRMSGKGFEPRDRLDRVLENLKLERVVLDVAEYPKKVVGGLREAMEVVDTAQADPVIPIGRGDGGSPGSAAP